MSIHDVRKLGREYCQTEGSAHYVKIRENSGIDAIEIAMVNGMFEDFAITNMVKYALRFKHTRNIEDLKKVSDYSHILAGVELEKQGREVVKILRSCENCHHHTKENMYECGHAISIAEDCRKNEYKFWLSMSESIKTTEIRQQDEVWKSEGVCDGCQKKGYCDEPCTKWFAVQQKKLKCLRPEVTD